MLFEFSCDVGGGIALFCEVVCLDQDAEMADDHVENHHQVFAAVDECFEYFE